MPDKIHYQQFDSLGRVQKVLVDNDAKKTTGHNTHKDNDGKPIEGVDRIETFGLNDKGQTLRVEYDNNGNGETNSKSYLVLDQYARAVARYTDNDNTEGTGKTIKVTIDGKEVELKGVDSYETYKHNANGQTIQIDRNTNAEGAAEEVVHIERDEYGREKGRYYDLDNNAKTGSGNKDQKGQEDQDDAIKLNDGRTLKGADRYETYEYNELGQAIQINKNFDGKGEFDEIEYRDVDKASGQVKGAYYNRDNDIKDGKALEKKTGETITLDGGKRTLEGIDNFTTYERDGQNRVITEKFNLDAKGGDDRVYHYELDANGNRIGEYQNLDNDTTKTVDGEAQITGTTHTLKDGREVVGIERYYEQKLDGNNRVYERTSNLDGKEHAESVSYYVRDALGREIARYDNTNNDVLSNGKPNPTGHSHTIMLNGKEVTVNGIDRIVENTHNEYGNVVQTRTNNTGEAGADKFTNITDNVYNERRQKVEDRSQVKIEESGKFEQSSANKYTHDIYGRQATREFDTDSAKDGFERVESYQYDSYGNLIDTKTDVLGDNIDVNATRTVERDLYGRDKFIRTYQADGTLTTKIEYLYNEYSQLMKGIHYSTETQVANNVIYTRDEFGRAATIWEDRNGNNVWDNGDVKLEHTYADSITNKLASRVLTQVTSNGETKVTNIYTYDELNRNIASFADRNNNGRFDSDETMEKISYIGETSSRDTAENYRGETLTSVYKFMYQDAEAGGQYIGYLDTNIARDETIVRYGFGGNRSTNDDYTSEKWGEFLDNAKGKVVEVILTNNLAKTELTLDNDVVAKLAKNPTLRINGDATDIVNLKDSGEFTKQTATVKAGSNEFHQYTTTVDGETYTLQIDTDIVVNML
ncbi:hypothetical protein [Mannheimia sp. ZY171111]|uniref:hypothetical protein n=1 Tax=Mannheimia sp. ZY171111 TaxID=2679995 RepID=UPI001ADD9D57|nr:hypothetical protein [Mannheimia sp. ZY171111]QTM01244.1 hypothetical protein GM698_06415 [Mannheimia sp. ZY171111]